MCRVGDCDATSARLTGSSRSGRAITITVGSVDPNDTQAQQEAAELAIGTAAAANM
jgi:hypothetical protein